MRLLLFIGLSGLLFSCSGKPWLAKDGKPEVINITNVTVIPGYNSESAAMNNAMHALGYTVSEAMIAGGGAAMGFMFQESAFPYIATKYEFMREVFCQGADIQFHLTRGPNARPSWDEVKKVMREGIPVILRVDIRYLPYRHGGKYGGDFTAYGLHYVTLFGIDTGKGTALVSDTEYSNLMEINLTDLDRAREAGRAANTVPGPGVQPVPQVKMHIVEPKSFTEAQSMPLLAKALSISRSWLPSCCTGPATPPASPSTSSGISSSSATTSFLMATE